MTLSRSYLKGRSIVAEVFVNYRTGDGDDVFARLVAPVDQRLKSLRT